MRLIVCCLVLLCGVSANRLVAQQAKPDDVGDAQRWERIGRLGDATHALKNRLPSFTCREEIESTEYSANKQGYHLLCKLQIMARFRVVREVEGMASTLHDHREIEKIDGHAVRDGYYPAPLRATGYLGYVLTFFDRGNHRCYQLVADKSTASTEQVTIRKRDNADKDCEYVRDGTLVHASFDSSDFTLRHFDENLPEIAGLGKSALNFSLDFAHTRIGGELYWLPQRFAVTVRAIDQKRESHWRSSYSSCNLFTSTARILDDVPDAPDSLHD